MSKQSIIVLCFVLIVGILIVNRSITESFHAEVSNVPKILWSYWDDPTTMPESVKLCMKSWKRYNPNYTIYMLNKKNYRQYVSIPESIANHPRFNDMPQRFADLLRIYVIKEHGGIWCDSSILMFQSLDEWMWSDTNKEFYGFSIQYGNHPNRKPVIENWFFAAPPRSPFIQRWLTEFLELMKFESARMYVDNLVARGVNNKDWCCPDYLAMHHAAAKVLQLDNYPLDRFKLWPAENGPFRYLVENNWNTRAAFEAACNSPSIRKPFMKMRSIERRFFESHMITEFSNNTCKWFP